MYQVGDLVQFTVSSVSAQGTNVYAYVWKFWDNSTIATVAGTAWKTINIGGNPANGDQLIYACNPVLVNGSSVELAGTVCAQNPPMVAPSPTISDNDDYYGFTSTLSVSAFDIDGNTPLTFGWYENGAYLGPGVNGATSMVPYTWVGNGTQVFGVYPAQENSLVVTVTADTVITWTGTDTAGGTVSLDFELHGQPVPPLTGVLEVDTNSVTTDATSSPIQRIGPGQTVTFVAYVTDIDGLCPSFVWNLSNASPGNWTVAYLGPGTGAVLPDGSFSNTLVKDVSMEVVSSGTAKACEAICLVTGTNPASRSYGQTASLYFVVELLQNSPPTGTVITCANAATGAAVDMSASGPGVPAGTVLVYTAVTADPANDVVNQFWQVTNVPQGQSPLYAAGNLNMYGPQLVLDTTGYPPGQVTGQITSTDRFGGALTLAWTGPNIT